MVFLDPMSNVRGRPRASGASQSRIETEAEILRAAAKLFCTVGYSATSTRLIADTAGLRQASLYHYFKAKQDILLALLLETVKPSLHSANALIQTDASGPSKIWALCAFDVNLLSSGDYNLGALYLLPESSDESLKEFRNHRQELRACYATLVSELLMLPHAESATHAYLVMALVESTILTRREELGIPAEQLAALTADSALRMLGVSDSEIESARLSGLQLLQGLRISA
jgi:AcrR family transcriptional regulator